MASNNKRLGRGLSAILSNKDEEIRSATDKNADLIVGNIVELPLNEIEANPQQPRTEFSKEALDELATSIKELGVIQPITVRKIALNKYQIISGERRYRASKIAGLETIPSYVRIADDDQVLMMALVENIQRQDLDPIEVALSYQRMIDELNLTQEQMSDKVGKKRSTITNYLRLLSLEPVIQTGIRNGFISMGHGKAIMNIDDKDVQMDIYRKIIAQNLSVRETESLVQDIKNPKKKREVSTKDSFTSQYINDSIGTFRRFFNSNVSVKVGKNGKGKVEIPFTSEEDFKRIEKLLSGD